jgi:hypothetical protein
VHQSPSYLLSRSWSLFDYLPAEQSGQMRADAAQNGIDTSSRPGCVALAEVRPVLAQNSIWRD